MSTEIIQQKAKELHRVMNQVIPKQARDLGVSFFKSRFRAQGWLDQTFQPWPKRKRVDKKRPGRAILTDRARLLNSIRGQQQGTDIVFGSDVPYARVHNEGGIVTKPARSETFIRNRYKRGPKSKMFGGMGAFKKGVKAGQGLTFKAHTIKMPKRQFMGESAHLNKIIIRKIETTIKKVFQ